MPSMKDPNQIVRDTHDDKMNAQRVMLVGGEIIIPEVKLPDFKMGTEVKIERIEIPTIVKETVVERIEVPVIVQQIETRIEKIEVPVIVKETNIEIVEKPVVIETIKVVEIENPVVVERFKEIPNFVKVCLVAQTIALVGLLIVKLVK